ncbi:MAG: DUF808 domain-containing protein [Epsilonproteobacteria bacterium]|nr:DUF808 domain-containing protein [Campylobacterota bacterium]
MTGGFFSLFDDIATLMDDLALITKTAAKKTAGVLGDDLAVNAQKASNFASSRELPVLWAITKGSFLNKLIIVPIALLLSAFLPSAIPWILMLGGAYLAYEGFEKIYEFFFHKDEHKKKKERLKPLSKEEILKEEKEKIKSAIFTDFILSIEIVIIALGVVQNEPITTQIFVVSVVAFLATIGVYGIVALIVRLDDFGLALVNLNEEKNTISDKIGLFLISALPKIVKALSVIGTIAMLTVAGGIYMHHIHSIHKLLHSLPSLLGELTTGLVIGAIVFFVVEIFKKIFHKE